MTKFNNDKLKQIQESFTSYAYVPESKMEEHLIMYKEACSAYQEREEVANKLLKEKDEKIAKLNNVIKDAMRNFEELSQVTKVFTKLCEGTNEIGVYVALGSTGSCEGPMNMFCGIFTSEETALRKILDDHNKTISEKDKERYDEKYYITKKTSVPGEYDLMASHTYPNGEVHKRYIMTISIEKVNINEVY